MSAQLPPHTAEDVHRTPTIEELSGDPHPHLARMRARSPVTWVSDLDAFVVTGWSAAMDVLRDPTTFTVDDPRFSTGQVVGPSMLSLDGAAHTRHRDPFDGPFRSRQVSERFSPGIGHHVHRLLDAAVGHGGAVVDLRGALAAPLAARVMSDTLGLSGGSTNADTVGRLLVWYGAIVDSVAGVSAGCPVTTAGAEAIAALADAVVASLTGPSPGDVPSSEASSASEAWRPTRVDAQPSDAVQASDGRWGGGATAVLLDDGVRHGGLTVAEVVSNAAVIMFGGIETTEAMLLNALWFLLRAPDELAAVRADLDLVDAAVEESLRLEPAAAVVDRYATRDAVVAGTSIPTGTQVTVSLAGANRDPSEFTDPDRFDLRRPRRRRHLAFAAGPHVCIGMDLARLEVVTAMRALLTRFPALRLADGAPPPTGLVFRKPARLPVTLTSP